MEKPNITISRTKRDNSQCLCKTLYAVHATVYRLVRLLIFSLIYSQYLNGYNQVILPISAMLMLTDVRVVGSRMVEGLSGTKQSRWSGR